MNSKERTLAALKAQAELLPDAQERVKAMTRFAQERHQGKTSLDFLAWLRERSQRNFSVIEFIDALEDE